MFIFYVQPNPATQIHNQPVAFTTATGAARYIRQHWPTFKPVDGKVDFKKGHTVIFDAGMSQHAGPGHVALTRAPLFAREPAEYPAERDSVKWDLDKEEDLRKAKRKSAKAARR